MTETLNLGDDMSLTTELSHDYRSCILALEAVAQDLWHNHRSCGDEDYRDRAEAVEVEVRRLILELDLAQQDLAAKPSPPQQETPLQAW
jgi:hypothetical protein